MQPLRAQFNPTPPDEPGIVYRYQVNVSSPSNMSGCSGTGKYMQGENVMISTFCWMGGYTFSHWTLNGEYYTDQQYFEYTVPNFTSNFEAHYTFNPDTPEEPNVQYRRQLNLQVSPAGVASFNRNSGERVGIGEDIYLDVWGNQNYKFLGWYNGEEMISDTQGFTFTMPDKDVTLTAKFQYSPTLPDDPSGDGDVDVLQKGDVNRDGKVDIEDAKIVVTRYVEGDYSEGALKLYDVNGDGVIDVTDAVEIINLSKK